MSVNPNQHERIRNGKQYTATNPNGIIEDNISYEDKFGSIKTPGTKSIKQSIKDGSAKKISDYLEKHKSKKYDYTNKILDTFKEAGDYFEKKKAGTTNLIKEGFLLNDFKNKTLGEYNLKLDFYNFRNTDNITDKDGNVTQRFVYIDGYRVSLDALGNLLYGYNGIMAGLSTTEIENAALIVTLRKFWSIKKTLNNEAPDRELYKAGYGLAEEVKKNHGKLNASLLLKYLKPAYEKSLQIEKKLNSPKKDLQDIRNGN